jgi:hypothetical protein
MEFNYPDVYTTYELKDNLLKMKYVEGGEATVDLNEYLNS